jgi:hypothetical protein
MFCWHASLARRSSKPFESFAHVYQLKSFWVCRFVGRTSCPFRNPDFYDWNAAFLHYCDGASFGSSRPDPINTVDKNGKPKQLWMRGRNNFDALIGNLQDKYGMSKVRAAASKSRMNNVCVHTGGVGWVGVRMQACVQAGPGRGLCVRVARKVLASVRMRRDATTRTTPIQSVLSATCADHDLPSLISIHHNNQHENRPLR